MSKKMIRIGTEEYPIEYFYTEVTNENANKWNSIQHLAKKINIREDEIICIGDNINDLKMVKNAGVGIAMKNSALEKLNFKKPTLVQEKVIPQALKGNSLVVESATGSGKTHSFLLPIFKVVK